MFTLKNVVFVGLRLLSVYFIINTVSAMIGPAGLILADALGDINYLNIDHVQLWIQLLPFVLQFMIGVVVWIKAEVLTRLFLPRGGEENRVEVDRSPRDLQTIMFAGVGLLVLAQAIPETVRQFPGLYYLNQLDGRADTQMVLEVTVQMIAATLKLVLGIIFLLGAKGLSGLLHKIRNAGLKGNGQDTGGR
ncbi:MAG: hypothetical protein H0Z33_06810 [Bacillaceae bacterium]|nr:hypothetical protein [Bacillaceae bacterium]